MSKCITGLSKWRSIASSLCLTGSAILSLPFQPCCAGERPTFNKETCDPRPDILPYWLTTAHTDYRQIYNRPRYWPGRIAHCIEPTCQEAMVWCEANQMGLYNGFNQPPVYKTYNAPKPWEILATGPRPDFKKPTASSAGAANSTTTSQQPPAPQPSQEPATETGNPNTEDGSKQSSGSSRLDSNEVRIRAAQNVLLPVFK